MPVSWLWTVSLEPGISPLDKVGHPHYTLCSRLSLAPASPTLPRPHSHPIYSGGQTPRGDFPGSHDSHLATSWVICLAQASCRICYLLFIPEHWSQPCLLSPRFWFCSDLIVCPSVKLGLFGPKSSPSSQDLMLEDGG